jgi:hypothetical protein
MTIPLILEGAFDSEQALRDMIVTRKACSITTPTTCKESRGVKLHTFLCSPGRGHRAAGARSATAGGIRLDTRRGESVTAWHAGGRGH